MIQEQTAQSTLAHVIEAIGENNFAEIAANALCGLMDFDLSAIVVHPRNGSPDRIFDNFDRVGSRAGVENYVRHTHAINPMLKHVPSMRALRASDFAKRLPHDLSDEIGAYLRSAPEEELGFRTLGWPEKLEEIGLYFEACGGIVEFGFYRERTRRRIAPNKLKILDALRAPVAAAFQKHMSLQRRPQIFLSPLSAREQQICALMLAGCSSEAIALRLSLSRHTVKDHRKQIFRKLRVSSLAELFALHHGQPN